MSYSPSVTRIALLPISEAVESSITIFQFCFISVSSTFVNRLFLTILTFMIQWQSFFNILFPSKLCALSLYIPLLLVHYSNDIPSQFDPIPKTPFSSFWSNAMIPEPILLFNETPARQETIVSFSLIHIIVYIYLIEILLIFWVLVNLKFYDHQYFYWDTISRKTVNPILETQTEPMRRSQTLP